MVIVDLLARACERARERLAGHGITMELHRYDDAPKPGARLDAASSTGLAQLLLWETGELDLVIADVASGDVLVNEHREVTSEIGIADALGTIETYLSVNRT